MTKIEKWMVMPPYHMMMAIVPQSIRKGKTNEELWIEMNMENAGDTKKEAWKKFMECAKDANKSNIVSFGLTEKEQFKAFGFNAQQVLVIA